MKVIDQIRVIEQDLRQFGQAQTLVLDNDTIRQLAVLCDRLWSLRVDMRCEHENSMDG